MTANANLTKEEQLIAFFVSQVPNDFGRTALMKYLYLADYEARRFLGEPITNIDYVWHHYGPYDSKLNARLNSLTSKNVIQEDCIEFPTGKPGYRYKRGTTTPAISFSAEEAAILQYVIEKYSGLDLQALLADVVYETEPMRAAQQENARSKSLKMDLVNGKRRNELGVPFELLLKSSQQARTGQTISFDALRLSLCEQAEIVAA